MRTRDAQAVMLLTDTTLVPQLTDEGLSRMNASVRDSALRGARVEDTRLMLEDLTGRRVFDRVEFNGRDVMNVLASRGGALRRCGKRGVTSVA